MKTKEIKNATDVQAEATPKKKSVSKTINTIVNVILVVVIVFAAVTTFMSFVTTSGNGVPSIFGVQFLSIQTDSMYPTLKPGDLAVDTPVKDFSKLRPGDIITYWTVIDGERVLNTHRIENIYDGGGYLIFETKGDHNTNVDPLTVHESEVMGQYRFHISGAGKVFDYLQTSTGFFLVVLLPVILFFVFNLVQFFRALFEYQAVKNRIKFEQERDIEEITSNQQTEEQKQEERAKLEAELREKLRAEILESMAKEKAEEKPEEDAAKTDEEIKE